MEPVRTDLCVSLSSPLGGKRLWKLGCSPWSSTPSCRKAVPPPGEFVCHPNCIFSITAYPKFTFFAFSLFYCALANSLPLMFGLWKAQSVHRIRNSCALQCRVKASFHGTGKSALYTPKLCQAAAQSRSLQQHLQPESSKNYCPLAFLKIVGRFIPHCNSCSSPCIVPVKRNICHGLLPPCEIFGWILLAQQSELHFKHCWLNLALTGAAPYWAVTMCWPGASPQFQTSSHLADLQDKSQWTAVSRKVFRCYCITEIVHREEFCRFLTVLKEVFKLKLMKLCKACGFFYPCQT